MKDSQTKREKGRHQQMDIERCWQAQEGETSSRCYLQTEDARDKMLCPSGSAPDLQALRILLATWQGARVHCVRDLSAASFLDVSRVTGCNNDRETNQHNHCLLPVLRVPWNATLPIL